MEITPEDVKKYQEMWREECGEKISEKKAREVITRVDALYLLFYRPSRRRFVGGPGSSGPSANPDSGEGYS